MDKMRLPSAWKEWNIVELLGSGSYGSVYRAERCVGTERFYSAIKIIQISPDKENLPMLIMQYETENSMKNYYRNVVRELVEEVRLMNRLKGISNIVFLEDYYVEEATDDIGWTIYIRMELLKGLEQYYLEHEMQEMDIIDMAIQLCTALEYCQKCKMIHRDIKPENIFVSDLGVFKLGDFGVAKQLENTQGCYSEKGTMAYMAPEVHRHMPYDIRADLYSLGMVLYHLCNRNRDPFIDLEKQNICYHDRKAALARRMSGEPIPAPVDAGAEFGKIILKACCFEKTDRYATPTEMKEDLIKLKLLSEEKRNKKGWGKNWKIALMMGICFAVGGITLFPWKSIKETKGKTESAQETVEETRETVEETRKTVEETRKTVEETTEAVEEQEEGKQLAVGDYITFGTYEQDGNSENGKEDIEWEVFDCQPGKILLVSRYVLDYFPEGSDQIWKESSLRAWLNEEFYQEAFSDEEKNRIVLSAVINDCNPKYGINGGENTTDFIFALSIEELEQRYGLDLMDEMPHEEVKAKATAYAIKKGIHTLTEGNVKNNLMYTEGDVGNCSWLLRSPGSYVRAGSYILTNGVIEYGKTKEAGVRPAIWIES